MSAVLGGLAVFLALFLGLGAGFDYWWTGVGALSITLMFRFASLPMIETRMLERRPAFADYQRRVSIVVPWPPKPSSSAAGG